MIRYLKQKYRQLVQKRYFDGDKPIRCTECGKTIVFGRPIQTELGETVKFQTIEFVAECFLCGKELGYYNHGHYSPEYKKTWLKGE